MISKHTLVHGMPRRFKRMRGIELKAGMVRIAMGLIAMLAMPLALAQTAFVHPGISHKKSDLDRIKLMVEAKVDPWYSSYQEMASDSKSGHDYVVQGSPTFTELGRDSRVNYGAWNSDIRAAYYNAIRWYVSGDVRHAEKAIEIFNAWRNLTSVTSGGTDALSGGVAYIMIEAAEIIKSTYSGWSASEIQDFSDMLVYPGYSTTEEPSGDTTFYWMSFQGDPGRHGNQGLSGWRTVMAMGIFLDNEIMYDRALRYIQGLPHRPDDLPYPPGPRTTKALLSSTDYVDSYSTNNFSSETDYGYNEVLTNYIWENGQCQESSRDQQHVFFGIGLLCSMAEMAWNQGDDLYSHANDRLLLGLEYNMRHNVSAIRSYPDQTTWWVPTVESGEFIQRLDRTARWFSKAISPDGVGGFPNVRPIFEMPLAHYQGRGLKTDEEVKWTERARDIAIEESGYEVAGWSNDGIGWGALTFRRPDHCHGDPVRGFSSGLPVYAMNVLPGAIEAENYDHFTIHGEGHTYHDETPGNSGGEYRTSEGVDVTTCTEGGHALTSLEADEWLTYTVAVPSAGIYDISIRYASSAAGGRIKFSFGGVDKTNEVAVPFGAPGSSGSTDWQTLKVASGVSLSEGVQSMKVSIAGTSNAFELNRIAIDRDPSVLVGHWKFDDSAGSTVADSSGNGFDGINVGASWVAGIDGGALGFDGSGSQVTLPAAAFSGISDQITVSIWVNGSAGQPVNNSVFYAVSGNQRVLNVHLPWGDSEVYWDAGSSSGYDRINKLATEAEFKDGWNHWVFTKDAGSGVMKIYLNGKLWHSGLGKTKTMTGITAATIGSQISGVHYDGNLDDVRLYDVALSEQEVSSLYYQTPFFVADGLVADATGATRIDLNWNAVDGAISYDLKRSSTSGGPYSLVAGGLTTTHHVDTGLTTGTEYFYVVSAIYGGIGSGNSDEASAVPFSPTGTSPVITTESLVEGAVGSSYYQTLTATGGEDPMVWSLASGTLPPGVELGSGGILSGTPSASGLGNFAVRVTDADGDVDTQFLSLQINGSGELPAEKLAVGEGDVIASEFQAPNEPANTLDEDLGSRWSAQGDGQWIRYDLGEVKRVHFLAIAWLNGSSRVSTFDVEVSDDDVTWVPIASGLQSSGTTTELETVDVADTLARYVRIVGHGNSTNNGWNSITELEIWGVPEFAPSTPAFITATAGDGEVALTWASSGGATHYHVKRSTTSGSGFSLIASEAGVSYLDTDVVNGTTYYYTISALNAAGESGDATQVGAKPHAPISEEELVAPVMARVGDGIEMTVQTVPGRIYQLQRNETLASDGWEDLGDPVIGAGTSIILSDPEAFVLPSCFYRVQIDP
ncbi:discoidin domain-containing protein [Haloferula rosea]|uniref:Discoidin domain-containing protein n=2 Tax=Haloferula rosea TaxID=490093 RepID=A0A934RF49_9BACT|nr:discoidin domain-containing protein [Haloferula rosea]